MLAIDLIYSLHNDCVFCFINTFKEKKKKNNQKDYYIDQKGKKRIRNKIKLLVVICKSLRPDIMF